MWGLTVRALKILEWKAQNRRRHICHSRVLRNRHCLAAAMHSNDRIAPVNFLSLAWHLARVDMHSPLDTHLGRVVNGRQRPPECDPARVVCWIDVQDIAHQRIGLEAVVDVKIRDERARCDRMDVELIPRCARRTDEEIARECEPSITGSVISATRLIPDEHMTTVVHISANHKPPSTCFAKLDDRDLR